MIRVNIIIGLIAIDKMAASFYQLKNNDIHLSREENNSVYSNFHDHAYNFI